MRTYLLITQIILFSRTWKRTFKKTLEMWKHLGEIELITITINYILNTINDKVFKIRKFTYTLRTLLSLHQSPINVNLYCSMARFAL